MAGLNNICVSIRGSIIYSNNRLSGFSSSEELLQVLTELRSQSAEHPPADTNQLSTRMLVETVSAPQPCQDIAFDLS